MPLTVKEVEAARPGPKDRKLSDEKGLYLLVTKAGSKRWYLKYRFGNRENRIGFGGYPEVSLKDARSKRDAARALLAAGTDPSAERKAKNLAAKTARRDTFSAIANELIAKRVADGVGGICQSTEDKARWLLSLLEPKLGSLPITEITAPMLLTVLEEIHRSGRRETARRLRAFAGRVFKHAIITGRAEHTPAPTLERALASPSVRHHPAIVDRDELGKLLKAIDGYSGHASTNAALKLSAHIFQRPGEIRTMQWSDVNLQTAVWTIPAIQTKMRREHRVPLSRQAIAIIRSMTHVAQHSRYVFPSFNSKKPLSENAVTGALKRLGYAHRMTAHGFRTTASSLLNESNLWNPDAIERALAHQDSNGVRAAYNRGAYWDERVRMAQWWSDELDEIKRTHGLCREKERAS